MEGSDDKHGDYTVTSKNLLKRWRSHIRILSIAHGQASDKNKELYIGLMTPAILLPIIFAPIDAMIGCTSDYSVIRIANISALVATGILNALVSFNAYHQKEIKHGQANNRLRDLMNLIDTEASKEVKNRTQADVLLNTIRLTVNEIGESAPTIAAAPFLEQPVPLIFNDDLLEAPLSQEELEEEQALLLKKALQHGTRFFYMFPWRQGKATK
jgi:hypothetical protein